MRCCVVRLQFDGTHRESVCVTERENVSAALPLTSDCVPHLGFQEDRPKTEAGVSRAISEWRKKKKPWFHGLLHAETNDAE